MKRIKLRGINYAFEDLHTDKKEVVLLVHGHPFDHTMWRYQHEVLQNFRLVLPDLRGYGKTDYQFSKIFIEEQALDLVYLLDYLGIEKVHLMGLSMGGQIIVEFVRLFPHRTRSLIVCDSNPSGETPVSYKNRLDLADRMEQIGMKTYIEEDIYKYLHPQTVAAKGQEYWHLFQMMIDTKVEGAVAAHRGRAERRDNFGYLPQIDVPTIIIVGDKDVFTPVNDLKTVANTIKNCKLVIISGAGHMTNMEQSASFNQVILDFLSQFG